MPVGRVGCAGGGHRRRFLAADSLRPCLIGGRRSSAPRRVRPFLLGRRGAPDVFGFGRRRAESCCSSSRIRFANESRVACSLRRRSVNSRSCRFSSVMVRSRSCRRASSSPSRKVKTCERTSRVCRWPSGAVSEREHLATDRTYAVMEPREPNPHRSVRVADAGPGATPLKARG